MHKSAMAAAVTVLLGACTGLMGPAAERPVEPTPAPATAPVESLVREAPPPAVAQTRPVPQNPPPARIDNRSIESFRASWERLNASLSPEQRTALNSAVVRLTFAPYGGATTLPANLRNSPLVPEMIRHRIAGLTFAEIIALSP